MPIQPEAQRSDQHPKHLVNDLQSSHGGRAYSLNHDGGTFLQTEPLGQGDRRERDDEE